MSEKEEILIVDDSADNLVVMKEVIQKALPQIEIATLEKPGKVMEFLSVSNVSAIVSDVQMPGMDGVELCKLIKGSDDTKHIPIILIISHNADPALKVRGLEAGADDFITRPINNSELVARVNVALRINRAEAGLRHVQQHTEAALATSERTLRAIFDNARDGISLMDVTTHRVHSANPAMCRMMGYAPEDMMALSVQDLHPESELTAVASSFERQITGGEPLASEIAMKRKHGSIFYADIHSEPVELGNMKYMLGTFRDVTERQQAGAELKKHRDQLEELVKERTAELTQVSTEQNRGYLLDRRVTGPVVARG